MGTTASPAPRVMFGPYRLEDQLAHGPFATVHRAVDSSHGNRVVALKVFSPQLSADPGFRTRFRRDAAQLGALREPHVVPIHRYGEFNGLAYLDMRLVDGPSLAEVQRQGPLDPVRAAAVAGQVRSALDAMRRAGLGDRVVTADEVLLTGSPERGEFVQLVGLGLGRPPAPVADPGLPDALVSAGRPRVAGARRRPTRRRLLVAVGATVAAIGAAVAVFLAGPFGSGAAGPSAPPERLALISTIAEPVAMIVDADTAELDGAPVLVATDANGSIQTWDLRTGAPVRSPIPGTANRIAAIELDGRPAVVTRTADGAMAIHDIGTGQPIGLPTVAGVVSEGALESTTADGAPAIVAAREDGSVDPAAPQVGLQLLALPGGEPLGPVLVGDGRSLPAHTVAEIDGRPTLVIIDAANRVVARDLITGEPLGVPTAQQPVQQSTLTTAVLDGIPVAVTGGADNTLRIWNLLTGELLGSPLVGHTQAVTAVDTVRLGDRTVLVSSTAGLVRPDKAETAFWDLATGTPLGPPLVGHPTNLTWLTTTVDGRAALITGADGTVAVWDAAVVAGAEQP